MRRNRLRLVMEDKMKKSLLQQKVHKWMYLHSAEHETATELGEAAAREFDPILYDNEEYDGHIIEWVWELAFDAMN